MVSGVYLFNDVDITVLNNHEYKTRIVVISIHDGLLLLYIGVIIIPFMHVVVWINTYALFYDG